MIPAKQYFLIPYGAVPVRPAFKIWSSTWSAERPVLEPSSSDALLVGYTEGALPDGATFLMSSPKDPPPPPPPSVATATEDLTAYRESFASWLEGAGRKLKAL